MPQPGSASNLVPNSPDDDVQRKLRDLQAQLDELRSRRSGLYVLDRTNSFPIATVGFLPDDVRFNHPDTGERQVATQFRRDDGTFALIIGELNANDEEYSQALQMFDKNGNIIIADDTNSGFGIARPHLQGGYFANSDTSTWMATSATSFTTIGDMEYEVQQPRVQWHMQTLCPSGTVAEYRILFNGFLQIGATFSHNGTVSTFMDWFDNVDLSTIPLSFGLSYEVELQARVALGTTTAVKCRQLAFAGNQSGL